MHRAGVFLAALLTLAAAFELPALGAVRFTTDTPPGPLLAAVGANSAVTPVGSSGQMNLVSSAAPVRAQAAAVWYQTGQLQADGFEASFAFTVQRDACPSPGTCVYGGISFVVRASVPTASTVGGTGAGNGVDGINGGVAFSLSWTETAGRFGIFSNGTGTLCETLACQVTTGTTPPLPNGLVHHVVISYTATTSYMTIQLDGQLLTAATLNLAGALGGLSATQQLWVGLAASSGGVVTEEVNVGSWYYRSGCAAGSYFGDDACVLCPAGTYSSAFSTEVGVRACQACPTDTTAGSGATACVPCESVPADDSRKTYCPPCPPNQSLQLNVNGTLTCQCKQGYYTSIAADNVTCQACPPNADCPGGDAYLSAQAGFYISRGIVVPCPYPKGCLPGNVCAAGYHGYLCATCNTGWFIENSQCFQCEAIGTYALVILAVGFFVVLVVFYNVREQLRVVAIAGSFVQTVGLMASSTSVSVPDLFSGFQRYASLASANVRVLPTVQCFFEWDYYHGWAYTTTGPLILLLVLILSAVFRICVGTFCVETSRCDPCCQRENDFKYLKAHFVLRKRDIYQDVAYQDDKCCGRCECACCCKACRCRDPCADNGCWRRCCYKCKTKVVNTKNAFKKMFTDVATIPVAAYRGVKVQRKMKEFEKNMATMQQGNFNPGKPLRCPWALCTVPLHDRNGRCSLELVLLDPVLNGLFTLFVLFSSQAMVSVVARTVEPFMCTVLPDGVPVITSHPNVICYDQDWILNVPTFFTLVIMVTFLGLFIVTNIMVVWLTLAVGCTTRLPKCCGCSQTCQRTLPVLLAPYYSGFGKNFVWWAIPQNFTQLWLSISLVWVQGTVRQFAVAIFILLTQLILNIYFSPYTIREHSDLEAAALLFSICLYIFGMLFASGQTDELVNGSFAVAGILMAVLILIILVRAVWFTELIVYDGAVDEDKLIDEAEHEFVEGSDPAYFPLVDFPLLERFLANLNETSPYYADLHNQQVESARKLQTWLGARSGYQLDSILNFEKKISTMEINFGIVPNPSVLINPEMFSTLMDEAANTSTPTAGDDPEAALQTATAIQLQNLQNIQTLQLFSMAGSHGPNGGFNFANYVEPTAPLSTPRTSVRLTPQNSSADLRTMITAPVSSKAPPKPPRPEDAMGEYRKKRADMMMKRQPGNYNEFQAPTSSNSNDSAGLHNSIAFRRPSLQRGGSGVMVSQTPPGVTPTGDSSGSTGSPRAIVVREAPRMPVAPQDSLSTIAESESGVTSPTAAAAAALPPAVTRETRAGSSRALPQTPPVGATEANGSPGRGTRTGSAAPLPDGASPPTRPSRAASSDRPTHLSAHTAYADTRQTRTGSDARPLPPSPSTSPQILDPRDAPGPGGRRPTVTTPTPAANETYDQDVVILPGGRVSRVATLTTQTAPVVNAQADIPMDVLIDAGSEGTYTEVSAGSVPVSAVTSPRPPKPTRPSGYTGVNDYQA